MRRALVLVAAVTLAACADNGPTPATTTIVTTTQSSTTTTTTAAATTTTQPVATTELMIFFTRDERLGVTRRTVPRTPAIARSALEELFAGVSEREAAAKLQNAVPPAVELVTVTVDAGVARVETTANLAEADNPRLVLAQIVFTLTQFPAVTAVSVLGGDPTTRDDLEDQLPPIFVEEPVPGQEVTATLAVRGSSNVFEATHHIRLVDADGGVLDEEVVTASSGSGTRGIYAVTLTSSVPRDQPGTLISFEQSAQDGRPVNVVEIPVQLQA